MKRKIFYFMLLVFIGLNIITCNHAWRFTHFTERESPRTKPEQLSIGQKAKIAFWGIPNSKSVNKSLPSRAYELVSLQSHEQLEGWLIDIPNKKGVVALFHGYTSCKGGMLGYAEELQEMGYSTFLIDFMGSGGSTGLQTTIGYKEAQDVKVTYDYLRERFPNYPLVLLGESMGAAAVMKAMADYTLEPDRLILHCPFGSMRKATQARFKVMGLPSFGLADMLMCYGSILNGFNAYKHRPSDYAQSIQTPTLMIWSKNDDRVSRVEFDEVYDNLKGEKSVGILTNSRHENYLKKDRQEWLNFTQVFLDSISLGGQKKNPPQ